MDPPISLKRKKYLFTDFRHIQCGFLKWVSPEGNLLPLNTPPEPPVKARADTGMCAQGVRLVVQRPEKGEPLEMPGGRILVDQGVYRTWHLAAHYPPRQDFGGYSKALPRSVEICCFESNDAVEWSEVSRSAIDVPGQTAFDGVAFFIDPCGSADERYKAVYTARPPASVWPALFEQYRALHPRYQDIRIVAFGLHSAIYAAVSPDGLHWNAVPEPVMIHHNDTDTSVTYDAWLDRYVMYGRLSVQDRRWIGRAETEDFYEWGPMEPLIGPALNGPCTDDVYLNGYSRYPDLPDVHLMFPMVYHRDTEGSDVFLYSSADGIHWHEVPGGPVLSPDPAGPDSLFISAGKDLVPLDTDRIGVRYSGSSKPHKYPRWPMDTAGWTRLSTWAWWPKDRICALEAAKDGSFWTFPMTPAGRTLRVNVRMRPGGELRVGVISIADEVQLDEDRPEGIDWLQAGLEVVPGRSVEDCDPVSGDHAGATVTWQGQSGLGVHDARRILLQFTLRAAELFSFEWV